MSTRRSPASRKKTLYEFPPPPQFTDPARRAKIQTAFSDLHQFLEQYAADQHVPGLAFGIVMDGALVYEFFHGVQNVETNTPVTRDTRFRIASMSKSFVAMAILKLRDEKKLRLDDRVAKYIPELKTLAYPTNDSPEITLRHLLTMSPGFPEDNPWGDRQMAITEREFSKWLRAGIPFSNAPNVTFEYSNYAYALLARLVSHVAGMPFQKYITKFILKPLGMHATVWDKSRVPQEHFALGYRWEDDLATNVGTYKPEPILSDGAFAGMAGLFTTIPDFARYMNFLLDAFPPRDDVDTGPVKRATVREMQQLARFEELVERKTSETTSWRAVSGYGFGLAIWHAELFGYGVSHGGGLPGYGSYFYLLPDYGIGLVAFTNKTYSGVGRQFPHLLERLAKSGGVQPRVILPSRVLVEMCNVVQHWLAGGDDAALISNAADNFFLDSDLEHRRASLEKIRDELGAIGRVGNFVALNALRGKWTIECERGALDVFVTLAPTMPPKLQMLNLTARVNETRDSSKVGEMDLTAPYHS